MVQTAVAALHPASPVTRLRELGVYSLPDGGEYVVSTLYSDGRGLYSRRAWETYELRLTASLRQDAVRSLASLSHNPHFHQKFATPPKTVRPRNVVPRTPRAAAHAL